MGWKQRENDMPAMQLGSAQEGRSVPQRDPRPGWDRLALLALRPLGRGIFR